MESKSTLYCTPVFVHCYQTSTSKGIHSPSIPTRSDHILSWLAMTLITTSSRLFYDQWVRLEADTDPVHSRTSQYLSRIDLRSFRRSLRSLSSTEVDVQPADHAVDYLTPPGARSIGLKVWTPDLVGATEERRSTILMGVHVPECNGGGVASDRHQHDLPAWFFALVPPVPADFL
jgi:hypothetical protein